MELFRYSIKSSNDFRSYVTTLKNQQLSSYAHRAYTIANRTEKMKLSLAESLSIWTIALDDDLKAKCKKFILENIVEASTLPAFQKLTHDEVCA